MPQIPLIPAKAGTQAFFESPRDAFTHRLAEAGFDKDHGPNVEGALLEAPIDSFFAEEARAGIT